MGRVVSDKMEKTVVVTVERRFRHPMFERIVRRSKKYMAHDEANACRQGDLVRIQETRPMSKNKRWKVIDVLDRQEAIVEKEPLEEGAAS